MTLQALLVGVLCGEQMAKHPKRQQQLFGGAWTQGKLERVQKYLRAYLQIFKKGSKGEYFSTIYVDAFAGSGYMQLPEMPESVLFPEEFNELKSEAYEYSKGSAVRALEIDPGFSQYLFVERDPHLATELRAVSERHSGKKIQIVTDDANVAIQQWCTKTDWEQTRAVVFLDPFGMQVDWKTVEALAATSGTDVWILFPIFAVNRMLVKHSKPPESWGTRLTTVFGTPDWENEFYVVERSRLIDGVVSVQKTADVQKISDFYVGRLRRIFAGVSEPLVLRNSKGTPLFLLVFAASNARGAPTALKIAQHILGNV